MNRANGVGVMDYKNILVEYRIRWAAADEESVLDEVIVSRDTHQNRFRKGSFNGL